MAPASSIRGTTITDTTVNATLFLFTCSLVVAGIAQASGDRISLKDGSTLRGTVLSIDGDEKLVINTDISPEPVELRASALRSINFEVKSGERQGDPELLHLVNGDILPGVLRSLDEEKLVFQTWFAGDLTIKRSNTRSIDFGVIPQKLVYMGPKPLTEWSDNDDWEWEDGKLICDTSGTIAAENVLPRQFILRFRLDWETGPNFRIYFCDDYLKRTGNADRYYFELNSMGSQLKRQTTEGGRRWHTLAQSHRRPEEFRDRGVNVELRVDRDRRQIFVYLNGEKLQRTPDPIDTFPAGTGIMLQSQAGGDLKNIVSNIAIYEWDAITELRRDEGHADPETDGLVDVEGQHISGKAVRLEEEAGKTRVIFESPFNNRPLKVNNERISSLYFKQVPDLPEGQAPIQFDLRGGGKLQLASLELGENQLNATHPLLGPLNLDRSCLEQLFVQTRDPQAEEESE